jgi:hypothetical protein
MSTPESRTNQEVIAMLNSGEYAAIKEGYDRISRAYFLQTR